MIIWVAPISAYFFDWSFEHLIKKYILCIDPSQLWFLWMLFGVFAVIWPLRWLMMKKPIIGWMIAICFYLMGIVGRKAIPNVFCIWTAFQYMPLFFVGMRIRSKEERVEKLIIEQIPWYCWIIVDVIVFAGTRLVAAQNGLIWNIARMVLIFVLHVVGAIMAWALLNSMASHVHWKKSKMFIKLSTYSMPMYLFHQQIIYFTISWLNGKVNPWINAGINFVGAVAGALLISSIMMRWKVTRFLIGEK